MKVDQIIEEYLNCKTRIHVLSEELNILSGISETTPMYFHNENLTNRYLPQQDINKLSNRKHELELKIKLDKAFVIKIEGILANLKERAEKHEYEMFVLRHFENRKLDYLAEKFGYDPSNVHRKLRKQEQQLLKILSLN